MKKILIPINCTDLDNFAYDLAHKIAEKEGASIDVLSVISAPTNVSYDPEGNLKEDEGRDFSAFYKERDEKETQIKEWLADKPDVSTLKVKVGRVNEDILHYAKTQDVDLIVMGTEGAAGFKQTFMGSHAGYMVGHSPVPVLTLKCDRSDLDFKDILLVSDFEKVEKVDLGMIKNLQSAFDAKIHLLRVNTAGHFKPHRVIREHMVQFAELNDLQNVAFHIYGDESVEKGIVDFSDDNGISFVALGTHQRQGFSHLFKHSVSKDLVNHIYQPVLVFPI